MNPSTVLRTLLALEAEGMVRRDIVSDRFTVGLELLRIGRLANVNTSLKRLARPHLERIVAEVNESAFLALYDSNRRQMLRVDRAQCAHEIQYVVSLDVWTEVYKGASGLAILAYLPPAEQDEIIQLAEQESIVDGFEFDPRHLRRELETISKRGYACTHSRRIKGAVGIAAPIFGPLGYAIGDIIITVPETRFAETDMPRYASLVMAAADIITGQTGGVRTPVDSLRGR